MRAAILVRVSTQKQENDRQIHELTKAAEAKGWEVVEVIEEKSSGALRSRPGLDRAIELAESGTIQKVMVHEISRVARRNSTAHDFLEKLDDAKVSLYWHSQSIETLMPNGKRNPAAGIMFAMLAEMARAERETLSERTKSGLQRAVRDGKILGRPQNSGDTPQRFLAKHADIQRCLLKGQSVRDTAKITGKSTATVQKVKGQIPSPTPAAYPALKMASTLSA
jgi:DNA invertase Pin-like site-specific DNA recombinase